MDESLTGVNGKMVALKDDDREQWLSRLLDGELEGPEKEAVIAKVRQDEKWRKAFEQLKADDKSVAKVLQKYSEDDGFTTKLMACIKKSQRPVVVQRPVHRFSHRVRPIRRTARAGSFWPMGIAASLAIFAGAAILINSYMNRQHDPVTTPNVATVGNTSDYNITEDVRAINWPDGTKILAKKGAAITKVDDRTLKLSGEAYFHVAKNAKPFTVISGQQKAQALGTRFDVKAYADGARVRVAEGHVRVQFSESKTVDAKGGTEVNPDSKVRVIDPREVSAAWNQPDDSIPAWSQGGGSATHSFVTPLSGPANLVGTSEKFFALPEKAEAPSHGALISPDNRAYLLLQFGNETRLMELRLNDARGTWRTCGVNMGAPQIAPVMTPRGLIITAQMDGTINAYDPNTDKIAWTTKESSMIRALCAAPDETILTTTTGGIVAFDGKTGERVWKCAEAADVQCAVSVLPSGNYCAVSEYGKVYVIDRSAKITSTYNWPRNIMQAPAATSVNGVDTIWMTSGDGWVGRMSLDKGTLNEKYFGYQLKCAPIATGLLGVGGLAMQFDQPAAVIAPAEDTVVALVQTGRNDLFAGYRRGVLHVKANTPAAAMAQLKSLDYSNIAKGELIRQGIAVGNNCLIATTTAGIQIFE